MACVIDSGAMMCPVLVITGGKIRGKRVAGDVVAYLGIPYAAAPFGLRRFGAPEPTWWRGVRDCTRFGPVAPQSAVLPGMPSWRPGDEDVLTVNVWAPDRARDLPVLFWVHGGAYTFGSSAQPDFDGTALAQAGLVVVTCNYRLGFEGFGHVEDHPDNRGLLDQQAALRWVQDNVAAFGGDPANITAAGQSAGAASVALLDARRAILHSPPDKHFTPDLAAEIADQVGMGTPAELVAASDRVVERYRTDPTSGRLHYEPVIYGPVLDASPLSFIPDDTELLVCHTAHEYGLMHAVGAIAPVETEDELAAFAEVFDLEPPLEGTVRDRYLGALSEAVFVGPARALTSAFGARFESGPAWHCADVPYAFGNLDAPGADFLIGGPPDRSLSRRMLRAWVDFATTGDPGWPRGHEHVWV